MGKIKLKTKYDEYKQRIGTKNQGISKCNKEDAEDTNIYKCIEKYGMGMILQQTQAMEPMYLDMTTMPKTIAEAVEMQNQCEEYFNSMPARARKVFNDNKDVFYQKYIKGEFADFITTGALTDEMVSALKIDSSAIFNTDLSNTQMKGDIKNENAQMVENSTSDSNLNTNGN